MIGPDLKPLPLKIEQTAPGRYVGEFARSQPGSYFVDVSPGPGMAPIRTGVNVPVLRRIPRPGAQRGAAGPAGGDGAAGGVRGVVLPPLDDATPLAAAAGGGHLPPRPAQGHQQPGRLALAVLWRCCVFFGDVFVRRVQVGFGWVPPLAGQALDCVLRRKPGGQARETMDRLRSRKAEVAEQFEQLRAGTRFEAAAGTPARAGRRPPRRRTC